MIRLYDISLPQGGDLPSYILNKFGTPVPFTVYRRSIDARRGKPLRFVYAVDIMPDHEHSALRLLKGMKYELLPDGGYVCPEKKVSSSRPVVVGFGPAGMFAALLLAKAGARPIVLERGKSVDERVKSVELFWRTGVLDTESNVQFGEGGAGSFSDGKLNTLVKDKNYRGRFVLSTFVSHGAPEDIMYDAKPHIGTDLLRGCVKGIREEIISLGGEVLFGARMTDIGMANGGIRSVKYVLNGEEGVILTDAVFLGIGHSARDTFKMLAGKVNMEQKPFSVGVRIEHPRQMIDTAQYREHAPFLPAASYKLSHQTASGRGVYTFCMCPGGYVVNASSEQNRLVTNGMSYRARDGANSNSALLVGLTPADYGTGLFDGMLFQQRLEEKAFTLGGGDWRAPCQTVGSFLGARKESASVTPTFSNGVKEGDMRALFPNFITDSLREGIRAFGKKLAGFDMSGAVITGAESRSTCPLRITRDENGVSSVKGLYPIGEGAGYAGGIMSAAMDGMKAVENYCKQ